MALYHCQSLTLSTLSVPNMLYTITVSPWPSVHYHCQSPTCCILSLSVPDTQYTITVSPQHAVYYHCQSLTLGTLSLSVPNMLYIITVSPWHLVHYHHHSPTRCTLSLTVPDTPIHYHCQSLTHSTLSLSVPNTLYTITVSPWHGTHHCRSDTVHYYSVPDMQYSIIVISVSPRHQLEVDHHNDLACPLQCVFLADLNQNGPSKVLMLADAGLMYKTSNDTQSSATSK